MQPVYQYDGVTCYALQLYITKLWVFFAFQQLHISINENSPDPWQKIFCSKKNKKTKIKIKIHKKKKVIV